MKCYVKLFGVWVLAMLGAVLAIGAFVLAVFALSSAWASIVPQEWVMAATMLTAIGICIGWVVFLDRKNICSDDCP